MKTNTFLTILLLLIVALNSCKEKKQQQRPNIIFIMSDDHAYQAISAYGHGLNKTPILTDWLMKEFVFRIVLSPIRFVHPAGQYCLPEHITILTAI